MSGLGIFLIIYGVGIPIAGMLAHIGQRLVTDSMPYSLVLRVVGVLLWPLLVILLAVLVFVVGTTFIVMVIKVVRRELKRLREQEKETPPV
jgi:hypothetical protein